MPSASYSAAYTAASIVPADCGCDGTQTLEIRSLLFAKDPSAGYPPRSPQPAACPTPTGAAFLLPSEAMSAEDERSPGPQIIGQPGIIDVHPLSLRSNFLRPLQHLVHLIIEVHIADQGRNYSLNAKDNFEFDRAVGYQREG